MSRSRPGLTKLRPAATFSSCLVRLLGGPPVGRGPGTVVTVRLDEELLAALLKRAADEGITNRSEAVRAAVKQWAHVAA